MGMTIEEYRNRMIKAFQNAECEGLIALVVLPSEKEFEHLEWLLKNFYKTPQEPKTGHWIDKNKNSAVCSCCNRSNILYGNFCKWCGAKMIEPQESEDV